MEETKVKALIILVERMEKQISAGEIEKTPEGRLLMDDRTLLLLGLLGREIGEKQALIEHAKEVEKTTQYQKEALEIMEKYKSLLLGPRSGTIQ